MQKLTLKFDNNLPYQQQAINAVVGIFKGQAECNDRFTMPAIYGMESIELGLSNKLVLTSETILENTNNIQRTNNLPFSESLHNDHTIIENDFTIEMETGTGKTYVYLSTIMQLHKKYGFSKFIIVVPSVAIREGVVKTLNITKEHFKSIYENVSYNYKAYDSSKLSELRTFASSSNLEIMVMNIDAFNKDTQDEKKTGNKIFSHNDKIGGRAIDFIREVNPIVIIDEPQSVITKDKKKGLNKSKEALKKLNPLAIFRYSATHVTKDNLLYKLNAVDAYNQKLVKQIEVHSVISEDDYSQPYIKLVSTTATKSKISAKLELFCKGNYENITSTRYKKIKTVSKGDDLSEISGNDNYKGYIIAEINHKEKYISFTNINKKISVGNSIHNNTDDIQSRQILQTIKSHLDKKLSYEKQGIKVLSLFFIDRVNNYRIHDKNNAKGKFAIEFEKHLKNELLSDKYKNLFMDRKTEEEIDQYVQSVHQGYFSKDKKGLKDSTTGKSKEDESTYNLIMKDKEKLLSLDNHVEFIFSHSALKEGWDNPNVFQICTLNENSKSIIKKRQEIGRGLRIPVNQQGTRIHDDKINLLTVIANESYDEFASKLQTEIEEDIGMIFGKIQPSSFANIILSYDDNKFPIMLGIEKSESIYKEMIGNNYIDQKGKILHKCTEDINNNTFSLSDEFQEIIQDVEQVITTSLDNIKIHKAVERISVSKNKKAFESTYFMELWNKIKYKTIYNVNFDTQELITKASEKLKKLTISKPSHSVEINQMTIQEISGVGSSNRKLNSDKYNKQHNIPDFIGVFQQETNLKRSTLMNIVKESNSLDQFMNNPQLYIDDALSKIKETMQELMVEGIEYFKKEGDNSLYECEILQENIGEYFKDNVIKTEKSLYEYTIFDSGIESKIATEFEENEAVKLYTKLPRSFKINTPLGKYNPDWAVVVEQDTATNLYFIIETKGSNSLLELRPMERFKIECAKKHFTAIDTGIKMNFGTDYCNTIGNHLT